jgi:hypothetical protein
VRKIWIVFLDAELKCSGSSENRSDSSTKTTAEKLILSSVKNLN